VRFPSLDACLDALEEEQGVEIEAEGETFALELRRMGIGM
jgi:hypothetical protein